MAKPTWIPKWLWWAKGDIVFWAIGFVLTTVKGTKFYETWNWDGAFLGVGLAIVLITTVRLVQGPKASDPPDEHPKFEWLAKMAESELQNVGSGVRVKAERIVPQLNNADGPPYIDCILSIYNGSVWPIALDKVTGSVRLNDQLLRPPEIVHNIGMSSLIQHTSAHEVIFRQWLEDGLLGVIKSSMTPMTFSFSE